MSPSAHDPAAVARGTATLATRLVGSAWHRYVERMPIVRINEFQAAEGRAADLLAFLRNVIEVVRREPGCLSVQLLVAHDSGDNLAILETWASVADHQAAAMAIPPEQLAQVRPLLGAPPRGRYYSPA